MLDAATHTSAKLKMQPDVSLVKPQLSMHISPRMPGFDCRAFEVAMGRNFSEHFCFFPPITRWLKYDRDWLCVNKSQFVPIIFEPSCVISLFLSVIRAWYSSLQYQWTGLYTTPTIVILWHRLLGTYLCGHSPVLGRCRCCSWWLFSQEVAHWNLKEQRVRKVRILVRQAGEFIH